MAKVLQAGTRSLLRERVLARLIRGEISRDEAIAEAGIDWVLLTERQAEERNRGGALFTRPLPHA